MNEHGRLAGKVAVVTGAGAGFGEAAATRFAAEGARVLCVDRDPDRAGSVAERITRDGGASVPFAADVASAHDNEAMVEAALRAYDRIDVVFANAGVAGPGSATNTTEDEWQTVVDVNLKSVWLAAKYALPTMIAQGSGSFVATASVGGLVGLKGVLPYAAAKGGVVAMVKQMGYDYSHHGIRFNAICPGTIRTQLVDETYRERLRRAGSTDLDRDVAAGLSEMTGRYPAGRLGDVQDVSSAALYLASDESAWVTGTAMPVDGGYTSV